MLVISKWIQIGGRGGKYRSGAKYTVTPVLPDLISAKFWKNLLRFCINVKMYINLIHVFIWKILIEVLSWERAPVGHLLYLTLIHIILPFLSKLRNWKFSLIVFLPLLFYFILFLKFSSENIYLLIWPIHTIYRKIMSKIISAWIRYLSFFYIIHKFVSFSSKNYSG